MESFNGHFKQEGNPLFLDAANMEELRINIVKIDEVLQHETPSFQSGLCIAHGLY